MAFNGGTHVFLAWRVGHCSSLVLCEPRCLEINRLFIHVRSWLFILVSYCIKKGLFLVFCHALSVFILVVDDLLVVASLKDFYPTLLKLQLVMICFSLFHLSHPWSKPILSILVVNHNVFELFLHKFFLSPVIEDAQLDFFEVYLLLECFKLLNFKFSKNSQECLCCHV